MNILTINYLGTAIRLIDLRAARWLTIERGAALLLWGTMLTGLVEAILLFLENDYWTAVARLVAVMVFWRLGHFGDIGLNKLDNTRSMSGWTSLSLRIGLLTALSVGENAAFFRADQLGGLVSNVLMFGAGITLCWAQTRERIPVFFGWLRMRIRAVVVPVVSTLVMGPKPVITPATAANPWNPSMPLPAR